MTFSGRYTCAFEVSWFEPDGSTERWWASGVLPGMDEPDRWRERIYHVTVRGVPGPKGSYGHLGMCEREFVVEEVLSCKQLSTRGHEL